MFRYAWKRSIPNTIYGQEFLLNLRIVRFCIRSGKRPATMMHSGPSHRRHICLNLLEGSAVNCVGKSIFSWGKSSLHLAWYLSRGIVPAKPLACRRGLLQPASRPFAWLHFLLSFSTKSLPAGYRSLMASATESWSEFILHCPLVQATSR